MIHISYLLTKEQFWKNVKFLGIPIGNNLSLEDHLSPLSKKTSNELNAIHPMKKKNVYGFQNKRNPYKLFCVLSFNYFVIAFLYIQVDEKNSWKKIFDSDYITLLLNKHNKAIMEVKGELHHGN